MSDTNTITTKTIAQELNKWTITNHNSTANIEVEGKIFDKNNFEKALKKISQKVSEPGQEMKETSE